MGAGQEGAEEEEEAGEEDLLASLSSFNFFLGWDLSSFSFSACKKHHRDQPF